MSDPALESGVVRVLVRHGVAATGVIAAERLTGGASAETWSFDVSLADGTSLPLIARRGVPGVPTFGGANPKAVEAAAQEAARRAGVPAARVLGVFDAEDGIGDGYLMERCRGETVPKKLFRDPTLDEVRASMAARCGTTLARLHATPLAEVPGLRVEPPTVQLDGLEAYYRKVSAPRPVFELALVELRRTLPPDEPATLVHGDFRTGNLMIDPTGIVAVLDWELTHAGSPMEDLGWVCVNAWRFGRADRPVGGFGARAELFEAYEAASGRSVAAATVRFWELLGTLKWGVICLFQVQAFLSGASKSIERAAIGRRLAEVDVDILDILDTEVST